MKFEVAEYSNNGNSIQTMRLLHRNEEVIWPVPGYKSASIAYKETLFDDVNLLIEKLDDKTQNKLWDIYMEVRETLKNVNDPVELHEKLRGHVATIYEVVNYLTVRSMVYRTLGEMVILPPNLKTEYTDNDRQTRHFEHRTYLREDYIDLAILVLAFRFMIPIWGVYITMVTDINGNIFKEEKGLDLINGTPLAEWAPMKRLRSYVEFSIDDNRIGLSVLFGCLSTSEVPRHLTALAVVRKLAVAPLKARVDSDNLIKILYNLVKGTNDRMDSRFGGTIGTKKLIKENGDEDNSSVWDMYKINMDVPDGDKALIEVFCKNIPLIVEKIAPNIDQRKVDLCLESVKSLGDLEDYPHQEAMCMWVIGQIIPPEGVGALKKVQLLDIMAVTQAVLWDLGLIELAILVTASRVELDADSMYSPGDLSKVDKQLLERLNVLYPYWRQETGKLDPNKRTNIAVNAINQIAKETNVSEWSPNAPSELVKEFPPLAYNKTWALSGDFKSQLATMILALYEPKLSFEA